MTAAIAAYMAIYTCVGGPSCVSIPSSRSWYTLADCEREARLTAQGIYAMSGNKYGFECKPVDYEPPNLGRTKP